MTLNYTILFIINALPLMNAPSTFFITKKHYVPPDNVVFSHLKTLTFLPNIHIKDQTEAIIFIEKVLFCTKKLHIFDSKFTCNKFLLLGGKMHAPGVFIMNYMIHIFISHTYMGIHGSSVVCAFIIHSVCSLYHCY